MLTILLSAATVEVASADEAAESEIPDPSIATSMPDKGDPAGIRAALYAKGIKYGFNYIGEILDNASGGQRQGAIYEGRLEAVLDVNLERLAGLKDLSFHANAYQIHGSGLTEKNLGNLLVASSIEALPSTRLYEMWLEQKIGFVSVRAGQLAADTEFLISTNAANFVNSTFGWPGITAADLPSGGPAYPLATPGVRLKFEPNEHFAWLSAVFDGDPAGPGTDNPQKRDRGGLSFRVNDPALLMSEVQFKYGQEKTASALSSRIALGGWWHLGDFSSPRFDNAGRSLANPASTGVATTLDGNYGFYGIIDQQIYRLSASDIDKGVSIFGRVIGAPADRNLINFYFDAGLVFTGMIATRPDDNFGAAFAYASISSSVSGLDRDANLFNGTALPVRNFESLIEVYYKAQIIPGLVVQPDFQYIWNPGGHIAGQNGTAVGDAVIGGVRLSVNY